MSATDGPLPRSLAPPRVVRTAQGREHVRNQRIEVFDGEPGHALEHTRMRTERGVTQHPQPPTSASAPTHLGLVILSIPPRHAYCEGELVDIVVPDGEHNMIQRRSALSHVFWLGGSPCSGKTSIAAILA